MALGLNTVALAFFAAAAWAFWSRRQLLVTLFGALFVPTAGSAAILVFWPVSPVLAFAVMLPTLGLSLMGLLLFFIDRVWAPFCLEMTYAALLCWVLWPALLALNLAGFAARWAFA